MGPQAPKRVRLGTRAVHIPTAGGARTPLALARGIQMEPRRADADVFLGLRALGLRFTGRRLPAPSGRPAATHLLRDCVGTVSVPRSDNAPIGPVALHHERA